jgi:hypothetical protein
MGNTYVSYEALFSDVELENFIVADAPYGGAIGV